MYALCLNNEDGRILYATYPDYAPADAVIVAALPDGDISDYRHVNGEYIFDPLPKLEESATQTTLEGRIAALEEENKHLKEALDLLLSGATEEEVTENG